MALDRTDRLSRRLALAVALAALVACRGDGDGLAADPEATLSVNGASQPVGRLLADLDAAELDGVRPVADVLVH